MLKNGWVCDVEIVTPEVASRLLENNEGNRRVRPAVVTKYAAAMIYGSWRATPEAIIVSKTGKLLNGQHRLHAIIKAGVAIPLFLVRNVEDGVFEALDRGATRSAADALGIDKKLAEVARLAAMVVDGRAIKSNTVLDAEIKEMAEILDADHRSLMAACNTAGKVFSAAPFRLAAVVRTLAGEDPDYIHSVYRNMILGNVGNLPPIAQSFVGAVAAGRIVRGTGSEAQKDMLARAWAIFDKSRMNLMKVQVKDSNVALSSIAKLISPYREVGQKS